MTSLQPEGTAIQTAVNALGGKQPDAALTARVRALQAKQDAANQELGRQQQQIQRNQQYVQQQIDAKLGSGDPAGHAAPRRESRG